MNNSYNVLLFRAIIMKIVTVGNSNVVNKTCQHSQFIITEAKVVII